MEEEMRVCPFDPQHRVCSSRFEIHLSKCQKQHPNKVVFCPFNAKHVLTSYAKLNSHLIECPDNNRIEYELKLNEIMNVLEQEKKAVEPDHKIDLTAIETENWDAEIKPSPMTSDMPTIGICYANMTRKQRKELNQKQIEAFNKKQNYSSSR